ncbi:hypothetical protein EYF80_005242 [Liparis tanakae]|uniref:Uncharacterized protein n=1 Tax=Liparis tanakae TaxID=230148 RepID=A0A4Z2J4Y6_9TELE|nr:hypothetical protein EYF80_005242 [Liparis tanakae]
MCARHEEPDAFDRLTTQASISPEALLAELRRCCLKMLTSSSSPSSHSQVCTSSSDQSAASSLE